MQNVKKEHQTRVQCGENLCGPKLPWHQHPPAGLASWDQFLPTAPSKYIFLHVHKYKPPLALHGKAGRAPSAFGFMSVLCNCVFFQ